jgi:hypothetical protein
MLTRVDVLNPNPKDFLRTNSRILDHDEDVLQGLFCEASNFSSVSGSIVRSRPTSVTILTVGATAITFHSTALPPLPHKRIY